MVKLLSIFSGLLFAQGHPSMHLALFIGSFSVLKASQSHEIAPYNTIANNYTAF